MDCLTQQDAHIIIELIDTMAIIDGFISGVFGAAFFHLGLFLCRKSKPRRDKQST